MPEMRERILDAAEARMRAVGYNATSFRDLAADVGVKSASVHYHFPSKEDLALAVVRRYAERQFAALAAATAGETDPARKAAAMIALHEAAFAPGQRICLCAMLAAESVGLPERVGRAVSGFFDSCLGYLAEAFAGLGPERAQVRAEAVLAALQGGLLLAAAARDGAHFARAAAGAQALAEGRAV